MRTISTKYAEIQQKVRKISRKSAESAGERTSSSIFLAIARKNVKQTTTAKPIENATSFHIGIDPIPDRGKTSLRLKQPLAKHIAKEAHSKRPENNSRKDGDKNATPPKYDEKGSHLAAR